MQLVTTTTAVVLAGLVGLSVPPAVQDAPGPEIGKPAPAFTLVDTHGKTRSLAEFKGKWVVLEWLNHGCPYVARHYKSGNMQRLQKQYTAKGVVWLSIVSSAEGKQGYSTPEKANALTEGKGAAPTAVLRDPEGTVGRLYDARNTPQMFVIDPEGVLLYDGAIDDSPRAKLDETTNAKNYVVAALDEAMAGKPVSTSKTKPYGCTVKYKR